MFNFKNYSIRVKLLIVFIIFKIIPLLVLATIGISSFYALEGLLYKNSQKIIHKSQESISKVANIAINDSVKALNKKSQEALERETVSIANRVANFLKRRDKDLLLLSKTKITKRVL